jgi:hypothetical protein
MKVWVDKRSLVPGTSWQQQLEDAIAHHSTAFAIYLSAAGAEHWVRIEVRAALERLIADGRNGVTYPFIPVIAADPGDIARLPRFAQQYQGVSLQDEQGLQKLIGVVLGTAPEARVPLVDEPFRGLEAFEADEAHLFFGRDRETRELIERLQRNGLVVVVGDSGSGKSSLVKAGVVPSFREGLLSDALAPRPPTAWWHVGPNRLAMSRCRGRGENCCVTESTRAGRPWPDSCVEAFLAVVDRDEHCCSFGSVYDAEPSLAPEPQRRRALAVAAQ